MTFTNTLIDRITNIRESGESYNNANILKNRKSEIENFLIPFNELFNKFNEVYASYNALKGIIPTTFVDLTSIQSNCVQLKNKIIHDEYERNIITALKRELERISNELLKVWKLYISQRVSSIDGVLETLGNLISEMPEKQILQSKKYVFNSSPIGSSSAVTAIDEYVSTYNVLMGKLNLSNGVLDFLKLLTSGRTVTLSDMNTEVYEWIKTSGFAGKINLRI